MEPLHPYSNCHYTDETHSNLVFCFRKIYHSNRIIYDKHVMINLFKDINLMTGSDTVYGSIKKTLPSIYATIAETLTDHLKYLLSVFSYDPFIFINERTA